MVATSHICSYKLKFELIEIKVKIQFFNTLAILPGLSSHMVTMSDSTDTKYFLYHSIGNLDSEMKPDLGFKKKKKIWPKLHVRCFPLFWHCYTATPFHTILLHTLPRIRMSSPIYPSFKDLFKACFFPRPFSLPEHYGIHTYKMLCSECLSKTAGLTKRTLYSVSSAPLSFFFLFILTCERAVPHQDGNIDFSGQTVDTTFGENSPIPSYKGHIDLHLSSWPPRFVQSH